MAAQVVELSTFAVTIQQLARNQKLLAGLAALVDRSVIVVAGSFGTNLTYLRSVPVCGAFDEFDPSSFAEELGAGLNKGSRTYRDERRELLAQ
ncbi:MAG: hypothetical protein M3N45_05975 [Actinomycetota bacterium]|nr:hypothetical protein [Actinomycetota bacterium]